MMHFTRAALMFFLLFLSGFSVSGQTANFTEDYISGCAPLVVHFTNTSTGATFYSWDLGNGVITGITNPSTSYLSAGTYTVRLTAYSGTSSNVHTVTITVYPTPTVSFTADDTSVCPGVPVTFTSTTSSGVAGPLTYMWNFGDGSSSASGTPSHAFSTPGYYNITLSATNSQGCVSSLTKAAYIHVFTPAAVSFVASPAYICHPPGDVTFTSSVTGSGPFSYAWSFGDMSNSFATNPTHTYASSGTYTVKLVVTDGNGCIDSVTRPGYIYVGSITAAFTGPATACVNAPVTFSNTSSAHISSVWSFGDGGSSSTDAGVHTYTTPGTYTVQLIISNGPCSDTVTHTITILPGAVASFTISPSNACPAPATATFSGTVPGGCTVVWKFGDGASGSGASTSHTYANSGVDTVRMIVTNSSGCIDTIKQVYYLYNLHISINHDTIPSGCVPLTVNFHCYTWTTVPDSVTHHPYPFGISSYRWDFGDGSPTVSGGIGITHTYTATGVYTCTVYIVTANGCLDTAHLTVLVGSPPVASFTATPTHLCAGQTVSFTNTSTGATNYLWFFGDSSASIITNPGHDYAIPGTYTVMLVAFNNGCPDTFIRTNYIIVDSPAAIIASEYACSPRNEVVFGDSSLGDNTHLWIFGDGTTSTADDPTHLYPALTTYTVTLATYNTASGCRDTATVLVDLRRPAVTFSANDTTVCRDEWVHFTATVIGDTSLSYFWFIDGAYVSDTGRNFVDTFHIRGLHSIMLITEDNHHCFDSVTKNNYILVAKPIGNFTAVPPSGCSPLIVNFTDVSTDVPGTTFTNYAWTFGDGGSASLSAVSTSHTYTAVGTYSVTEVVTDNIGCKDTVMVPNLIHVYRPHATFYATPTTPCVGQIVSFTNTSVGIVSSYWMFGDGSTSTLTSPTHVYSTPGGYTITLVVTDAHGCTDTARYVNYVNITRPDAEFSISDSFSICLPLSVTFTNLSTGATGGYYWTFGDGNSSTAVSPGDLYITSGYYTVMLIATNSYGCKDTAIKHVNIYGYAGAFTYTPDSGCAPLTVSFHANLTNVPNIIWDFGDGSTSSASSTVDTVHTYTIPGGYVPNLILSDNSGCQNSSRGLDTIKVDAVKTGFKTGPACIGKTVNFIDTSSSYWSTVDSWTWTFGTGDTSNLSAPTYLYTVAGTYTVILKATDAWGCTATQIEDVIIHPLPIVTTSVDTTVCLGDTATLRAYGAAIYTWSLPGTVSCSGCNPTQAWPIVATTYTVTGTDIFGCVNTDTVHVSMRTLTTSNAFGDTAVCQGTKVSIYDTGATTYLWLPPAGLSSNTISNPIVDPSATTTYTVIAQLGKCAPDVHYVTITVYPLPTVDAGPDQDIVAGTTAQLQATGSNIATYSWTPAWTLSCDDCANPVASMSVTTTYIVDVASPHDCRNSDSVTIHLHCSSNQVFIPNSFTPNGDGQNDVFYPRGKGIRLIKSFRIYNRWGEMLFERENFAINDVSSAWDGSYGGGTPRPDVYVYVIDAVCETGDPIFIKGDVTLIR